MQIRVGTAQTYRVEVRDEILNDDGEPIAAMCDYARRLILLSATMHRDRRRLELRHEVFHAFTWAFPGHREGEAEADFMASVSDDLDQQIDAMGGWSALDRLFAQHAMGKAGTGALEQIHAAEDAAEADPEAPRTGRQLDPVTQTVQSESEAYARDGRAQCGVCETVIGAAAIVTGKPNLLPSVGRVVTRTMYCAHCDHLVQWLEGVTPAGQPNGAVAMAPDYIGGREAVDAFLRKFPHTVGLVAGEA
jgi:hypothetical protein